MINLKAFREYCIELVAEVNANSPVKIDAMVMAVSEAHMVRKMAKKQGLMLCVTYPDAVGEGTDEALVEEQNAFFFVVKKTSGRDSDEEDMQTYEELQTVMAHLRNAIRNDVSECVNIIPSQDYRIDWEYQIFGGFNGLSLGIKFKNYD